MRENEPPAFLLFASLHTLETNRALNTIDRAVSLLLTEQVQKCGFWLNCATCPRIAVLMRLLDLNVCHTKKTKTKKNFLSPVWAGVGPG